jgi:hypothetical protein
MRFQQETNIIEVEQLKLLKGRFNPKTLVTEREDGQLPNQTYCFG